MYGYSQHLKIVYLSGIVRKCISCYFIDAANKIDICPTPGNCFLSEDETCKVCDSKDGIDCAVCADGHYKSGANCAKCPNDLRFCSLCSAADICTDCIFGY